MDSHETTNQKIAAILGWEIVPKHKENSGTFVAGKTYLLGHRDAAGRLRITHPERRSRDWSPATDTADALAALKTYSHSWTLEQYGTTGVRCWVRGIEGQGESECEAICKAIITAAEAAHG